MSLAKRTDFEDLGLMHDLVQGGKKQFKVKNLMAAFHHIRLNRDLALEIIDYYRDYQQCPLVLYWFMINKMK